jgi:hypothetical protein
LGALIERRTEMTGRSRDCGKCGHFGRGQSWRSDQGWGHCLCPLPAWAVAKLEGEMTGAGAFGVVNERRCYHDCLQFEPLRGAAEEEEESNG